MHADPRSAGMGSPFAVLSDHWSCFSNPAGISEVRTTTLAIFYRNYYGISDLGTGGFSCVLPANWGNFGLGLLSSGFTGITENRAALVYARPLGKQVRAGISLNWLNFNQPSDYRDLYAWIPALGIQWIPAKSWITGITIINPADQEYIPKGYRTIPACIAAGLGFKPSEEFFMLFEASKISHERIRLTLGIETTILKSFFLRFGINRQTRSDYSFGAGYYSKKIGIDASVNHHTILGLSPAFAFHIAF